MPYNKGGDFRLWYGNQQEVLWFDENGRKHMDTMSGHRENGGYNYYFHKGITWTFISTSSFGVRAIPSGFAFDVAGSTLFTDDKYYGYLLAFLSSSVCNHILKMLNPTLNFQAGNIKSLPLLFEQEKHIANKSEECIIHSKHDWDSFEISWDFQVHPLVRWSRNLRDATSIGATMDYYYGYKPEVQCSVELCYMLWQGECNERFKS